MAERFDRLIVRIPVTFKYRGIIPGQGLDVLSQFLDIPNEELCVGRDTDRLAVNFDIHRTGMGKSMFVAHQAMGGANCASGDPGLPG